jgi:hypothetical protein
VTLQKQKQEKPTHQKLDVPQSDYRLLHSGFGTGQARKICQNKNKKN